uniref:UTP--glucose-1-phosphate uridylyltransferase n=1 Tax=Phaeocystis antarctica TaxID=33657 RepID=A0A7S0EY20_9EUKA|mmetsp:Transcript_32351/g.76383  ORF Transcript_32351/g.76383 Transcript_32351/m.76383 type:complete len:685 (+) Transcript_32351:66-2120(+)
MSAHSDRASEGYGRWLEIFVPGRICLMGEHSDWAGSYRRFNRDLAPGMCLVSGTNQGMYARVRPHPHKLIVSSVDHAGNKYGPIELLMDPEVLLKAAASGDSYFSYIFGVAYQIAVRYNCRGLVIENYKTDLPQAKGLSSSAAATVLAARAFNRVYDLKLSVRGEMDLAYHGEITTPSQCGRMDQCCAFGARPVLMKFDGDLLECEELTLGAPLYIVIVELAGSKDTTTILQRLTKCFPVADNDEQTGLQNLLGAINTRIINAGIEALAAGDVQRLGELMTEAQMLFDRYATPICPSQLTAPNLHKILEHEPLKPHIWGAKGVGSQGDGCAQLLCRSIADMEVVTKMIERDFKMSCMSLQIGQTKPVTQALIPAASFSQQLFPASKSLPPALFPVLDLDGILKPAILILVEEALEANINSVIIVVSPAHRKDFADIFHAQLEIRDYNKLPPKLRQYAKKIHEIGAKVTIVVQDEQLGLGHAVLCAGPHMTGDPMLLMLGDHIYRSTHEQGTSCVQQLLSSYDGGSIMALRRTREADISHYGCVTGSWIPKSGKLGAKEFLTLTALVEKPTIEFAQSNLTIPGYDEGEYLTAFGLYIVTEPKLFDILKEIRTHTAANHTVQLTPALDQLRQDYGITGHVLQGERYDIGGAPSTYLETLNAFAHSGTPLGQLKEHQTESALKRPRK